MADKQDIVLPTYTIDQRLRLVRFDVSEHLPTLADLRTVLDQLAADPLFRPGFGVLVNVRHFSVDLSFVRSGILTITARLSAFGASRWAFLTTNVDRYFSRETAETFARRHSLAYRVFTDEAEALNWLSERRPTPLT